MTGRDEDTPKSVRRLKRWSIPLKCRIVEETFVPGVSVAMVARRNNANANQVFEWHKRYRQGTLVDKKTLASKALPAPDPATSAGQALLRIGVIDHDGGLCPPSDSTHPAPPPPETGKASPEQRPPGRIEITLPNGFMVRVDGEVDGVWQRFETNWAIGRHPRRHEGEDEFALYIEARTRHFKYRGAVVPGISQRPAFPASSAAFCSRPWSSSKANRIRGRRPIANSAWQLVESAGWVSVSARALPERRSRFSRGHVGTDIRARMAHFVANRCHTRKYLSSSHGSGTPCDSCC